MKNFTFRLLLLGLFFQLIIIALYCSTVRAEPVKMNFSGTLIDPLSCVVNGSKSMEANFGDMVMTDKVDGKNYMQKVQYSIVCTGNANNALKMQLSGLGTDFDPKAIKTTNVNLGIAIYNGTTRVAVNDYFNFTYPNLPDLKMVPVKRPGVTLEESGISGYVQMKLDYQ